MIVKNALKKLLPAVAASVALSGIYIGIAKADNIFDVIYITDVDDVIEVGAGYYENSTIIQNDLPTPTTLTADVYTDGNNDTITGSALTGDTEISISNERGTSNDISIGVDEEVTLAPGYYYGSFTIKNGVEHKDSFDITLDNPNLSYSIEEGYYTNGTVSLSENFYDVEDALYKLMESRFTYGMTFQEIAECINSISRNAEATAEYSVNEQESSNSIGVSESNSVNVTLVDETDGGQTIELGVDEQMTIPAGYYSDDFVISNGVSDRGNGDYVLDGDDPSVTLKEGYYSESTISIASTWYNLIDAINNTFGTTLNGDTGFEALALMLSGDKYQNNNTGTAIYSSKTEGDNTRIGTSEEELVLTDVNLSGQTIELGIDETLVIPAGYYGSDITITNGVVHRDAIDTTVSAFDDTSKGGEDTVTGEAGYYDSITVKDATPSGTITKSSIDGTTSTWDSTNSTWK